MFYAFYNNLSVSSDLVHWEYLGTTDDCNVVSYAYAGGNWVLTCTRRIHFFSEYKIFIFLITNRGYIYTSSDNGINFVQTFSEDGIMGNVVSDGTTFVATDGYNIFSSTDGKTWNTVGISCVSYAHKKVFTSPGWCSLSYVGEAPSGKFFFFGDQLMFVSDDGVNWVSVETKYYVASVSPVYQNGKLMFIATGKSFQHRVYKQDTMD